MAKTTAQTTDARWLLLIHQIPPQPGYLRVKVWRRLQRLGAVAIKKSVYALPRSEQALEDLQWLLREIAEDGGEGSVCEARFVVGLADDQVEALFRAARDADYAQVAEDARHLAGESSASPTTAEGRTRLESGVSRLRSRLAEIAAIDFFAASGRAAADEQISVLEARLQAAEPTSDSTGAATLSKSDVSDRTWVTRKGVHIDRMASAWLIRRFIDPRARFKFVSAKGYRPKRGELRFDMFQAEFTHEGDRCTFEVLVERFRILDAGLKAISEIVHDIDLKDGKFDRQEVPGIASVMTGIASLHEKDEVRLEQAAVIFDGLYTPHRRRR
jgi:hypothetical protein